MNQPGWLMWEARAADGQVDALLAWALAEAPEQAQVYRSADRVVIIISSSDQAFPEAPGELVARPAQAWTFVRVR